MTSKISVVLGFLTGAAIGGAAAWFYAKEKYACLAEEEIESVKAIYAQREQTLVEKAASDTPPTVLSSGKATEKGSIKDYAKRVQNAGYTEYSHTVASTPEPKASEIPYVISPDEFGESEDYTKVSLKYFEDGVLADEYGEVVDDVEEIVGDALEHFGDYEDDSVFVRNDAKRCDYEILRDLREFDEFLETLPPNH